MGKFTFGQAGGASYECDKVDLSAHEGAPRCPRCNDRVYFNEEKKALGKTWHARCFTCCQCHKTLSSTNYNEFDTEVMCTNCHRRCSAAPKGGATAATTDTTTQQTGRPVFVNKDDPECCPHCGQRVYFAEEIKALKRKWHRLCFKCVGCKKTLEPGRCTEHQKQLYCQPCYGKLFGPHRYASGSATMTTFGAGSSSVSTDTFTMPSSADERPSQPTQPIKGTQEWTESFFFEQPSNPRDRLTS